MQTLRTVSILDALGGKKPGFYEVFRLVTRNLGINRVSSESEPGGGGFIDIVDVN